MNKNLKIFICAFKSNVYLNEAKICIDTLRSNGQFTGEIYLFTDLDASHIHGINVVKLGCPNIYTAASSRFKCLDFVSTNPDDIILYLDTDIVALRELPCFDFVDEKIHVYGYNGEHGWNKRSQAEHSFSGCLTNDARIINQFPFCSGILLYRPCDNVRDLFFQSNEVFIQQMKNNKVNACWEQPALNLILCKYNMYEMSLNKFVHEERTNKKITQDAVFNHFCGMRGTRRAILMSKYLNGTLQG